MTASAESHDNAKTFVPLHSVSHEAMYWSSYCVLVLLLLITQKVLLPVLAQMVLYTGSIIYIGSHLSLQQKAIDPETGEKQVKAESMSRRDAWMFPVIGSGALLTLYLAYKFLPAYWVNLLLATYLTFFGCAALGETLFSILDHIVPSLAKTPVLEGYINLAFLSLADAVQLQATATRVIGHVVAIGFGVAWVLSKHWSLHNIFAMAFCLQGIRMVSVGNFKIACILLGGLFFYDIFWVFATDVMVTVAKSFEAPAKLIFPTSFNPWKHSILGLGDIVIPGVFIAMALRFDHHLHEQKLQSKKPSTTDIDIHQHFSKFYFWCNMIAYELGLVTTGLVMIVFQHPQPALLYLVPFCLAGLFLPAIIRGEYGCVLEYTEEDEEEIKSTAAEGHAEEPKKEK